MPAVTPTVRTIGSNFAFTVTGAGTFTLFTIDAQSKANLKVTSAYLPSEVTNFLTDQCQLALVVPSSKVAQVGLSLFSLATLTDGTTVSAAMVEAPADVFSCVISTSGAESVLVQFASSITGGYTLNPALDQAVSAAVTSVTASAPLASSGGLTPTISLTGTVAAANGGTGAAITDEHKVFAGPITGGPLAPSFRVLDTTDLPGSIVTRATITQGAPAAAVTFDASAASAYDVKINGATQVNFDFSAIPANVSVSCAAIITTGTAGAGDNVTNTSFAAINKWIGAAPALPTADVAETKYLVVATNFNGITIGSWQTLV